MIFPKQRDLIIINAVSTSEESNKRWAIPAICIFLAVITLAVYGQTLRYEFVNYDDNSYVYENPTVVAGLTIKGIESAFRLGESDNWIPLTTISHMLDCQIYGLNAGGHHLTNVLLHTASVIILFLVLRQMTGFLWRSAFVAAIFAVHPLHVESVAWVAERKDTLSGLFFMLTLLAYVGYVRRPASLSRYLIVLLFFALGLMSKPMLVTLPFVLLLLDYWPLKRISNFPPSAVLSTLRNIAMEDGLRRTGRFSISDLKNLLAEKIPLLMLSMVSCILTVFAQGQVHAMPSLNKLHLSIRIGNALLSCVTYVWQLFYPVGLAPHYPYPSHSLPLWNIIWAFVVLVAISSAAFIGRRKHPYLLVGWLWYLGMLIPVVGLVQVGSQALADRYTYLPQIGLCLMLVWLAADLSAGWRNRRLILGPAAAMIIIALVFLARAQASYWKDSETLWTHTIRVTSPNATAHLYLGVALRQKGDVDKAVIEYQKALEIDPDSAETCYDLGNALAEEGKMDEAIIQFQKARAIDPAYADPYDDLGNALIQKGQVDEAIIDYQKALAINPNNAQACYHLGNALLQKGQADKAIIQYQKALAIDPNYAQACNNLGNALIQKGQVDEAIIQYQRALAINPHYADPYCNLGNCLLQKGQVDQAIIQYRKALAINPNNAQACNNLGSCLLQKGKVDEAIIEYQKALAINPNNADLHCNLGDVLIQKGQIDEAIVEYQKALALQPGTVAAQNTLTRIAWVMATSPDSSLRNGTKAIELAQQADRLSGGNNPTTAATLAAAYAEAGKFPEAITNAQRALQLATRQNSTALIAALQAQLKCYQAGAPFRDPASAR